MLSMLIGIIGILITILLIVGVHEYGHFLLARLVGVKVLRFSIGFGKILFRWHDKKGTEYAFSAIPLGGYVKMLDTQEGEVPKEELHLAYDNQPIYKRFMIACAGPLFNLIFAFLIYWALFIVGFTALVPIVGKVTPYSIAEEAGIKPQYEIVSVNNVTTPTWMSVIIHILNQAGETGQMQMNVKKLNSEKVMPITLNLSHWRLDDLKPEPLESLGIAPYFPQIPTIVGEVRPDSNAYQKILPNDKIISVNKQPVHTWDDLLKIITTSPSESLSFVIQRNHKKITTTITLQSKRDIFFKKYGYLGIAPQFEWPAEMLRTQKYGPIAAFNRASQETLDLINLNFIVLGKMVTGKISVKSLGGPITIFESAGSALNSGTVSFLNFLAFLSIAIGIINILPIPGLDGGHVLLQLIEAVTRKPISLTFQAYYYRVGMLILLLIFIQAMINDILRL